MLECSEVAAPRGGVGELGHVHVDRAVQQIEAEAERAIDPDLFVPGQIQRDQHQHAGGHAAADDHQPALRDVGDQDGNQHRVDHSADPKSGDHQSRDRGARLAGRQQQQRHIGKHAVDEQAFQEHRAKADLGARIGEDATEAGHRRGHAERRALALIVAAQRQKGRDAYDQGEQPEGSEHTAPADQVGDHAGDGSAHEVAGQADRQEPPDRHLPLLDRHQIADQRQRDGKQAAGDASGHDPHGDQEWKAPGRCADQRRQRHHQQADIHQPGLAEVIAERPQHRLHQRIGEREGRRQ